MKWTEVSTTLILILFCPYCHGGVIEKDSQNCPQKEAIHPCRCQLLWQTPVSRKLWLTCSELSSPDILKKVIRAMNGSQVDTLMIKNSLVTDFTKEMFSGLAITDLLISLTNVTSISVREDSAFEHIPVQLLSFRECGLRDDVVRLDSLRGVTTLQTLVLNDNLLDKVRKSWFRGGKPKNLRTLQIRRNKITTIEAQTFKTLENLLHLDLSENRIKSLKRDFLPEHLETLWMSYNEIEFLPDGLFDLMTSLSHLHFDHNKLTVLKEEVWKELYERKQLRQLNLRDNPIICDFRLMWLPNAFRDGSKQFYGRCHSPKDLEGKSLASISHLDLEWE